MTRWQPKRTPTMSEQQAMKRAAQQVQCQKGKHTLRPPFAQENRSVPPVASSSIALPAWRSLRFLTLVQYGCSHVPVRVMRKLRCRDDPP